MKNFCEFFEQFYLAVLMRDLILKKKLIKTNEKGFNDDEWELEIDKKKEKFTYCKIEFLIQVKVEFKK